VSGRPVTVGLTPYQHRALAAMDIAVWQRRGGETGRQGAAACAEPAEDWSGLERQVAACTRCRLHETRTQTVFGVGSRAPDWMIIGEAPGADEDRQGEPFVGRAGRLLNEMLRAAGFRREEVFIANILKCRPPQNRDPHAEEVAACADYLNAQVSMLRPGLILAVGRIAAQNLLGSSAPLGRLRGTVHSWGEQEIPLVVTYHPAFLLRSPSQKARAWRDLCLALRNTRPREERDAA